MSAPLLMEDAETGEQLYVDTHDAGFRRRFREASERREATLSEAFRRAGVDAGRVVDRRRPRQSDRPDGDASSTAATEVGGVVHLAADARAAPGDPASAWRCTSSGSVGGGHGSWPWATCDRRRPPVVLVASAVRRRLPAALVVAGLTVLVLAMARPQSVVSVPRFEGTVILSFDVSGSMAATDVEPTRMEAAKTAARTFVAGQPPSILIGVVAFSDSGFSMLVPTEDAAPGAGRDRPARPRARDVDRPRASSRR